MGLRPLSLADPTFAMRMLWLSRGVVKQLREENKALRAENERLKLELEQKAANVEEDEAVYAPLALKPTADVPKDSFSTAYHSFGGRMPSMENIQLERRQSLGQLPIAARAEMVIDGVLPLAATFDKFDVDASGGINANELRAALEYLGVHTSEAHAQDMLAAYDRYPDRSLDVKEFANVVRDVKLMIAYDKTGTGMLDCDELHPALESLGIEVKREQVDKILAKFDADRNGSIDLVELGSLVRTAQAFVRYDTDKSGAIEIDELRDALRKLGVRAGSLEARSLFRRYDADGNDSLELHEFAGLVRDLQLYAAVDTNCDGAIDASELHSALLQLGLRPAHDETLAILRAANGSTSTARENVSVNDVVLTAAAAPADAPSSGAPSPTRIAPDTLILSHFSQLVADLRAFKEYSDEGVLDADGVRKALRELGLLRDEASVTALIASHTQREGPTFTMVQWVCLVHSIDGMGDNPMRVDGDMPVSVVGDGGFFNNPLATKIVRQPVAAPWPVPACISGSRSVDQCVLAACAANRLIDSLLRSSPRDGKTRPIFTRTAIRRAGPRLALPCALTSRPARGCAPGVSARLVVHRSRVSGVLRLREGIGGVCRCVSSQCNV